MYERSRYLDLLVRSKDTDYVKLLIGVRRSGKSTLLLMMEKYLVNNGVKSENIISINFEQIKNDYLRDGKNLHSFVESKIQNNGRYYLFLDEVQEINEWARVVNSLRVSYNLDIYATGSNARMFVGEHLTYLAGRYLSVYVYPLSYEEYLYFTNNETEFNKHYYNFLKCSFPGVVIRRDDETRDMLNHDVFKAIFDRDIRLRGNITDTNVLNSVSRYILEHIATSVSINKIKNTLNSSGINISYNLVNKFVDLMADAYFIYPCYRYDIKGKEILKSSQKYYVVDFGIREQVVPNSLSNQGRVLENFVYLELLKKGYKVYIGKIGRDYEIDFVAIKNDITIYVQVSQSIVDPNTRERETRVFDYLINNDQKYLVTMDEVYQEKSDKFTHLNIFEFIKKI